MFCKGYADGFESDDGYVGRPEIIPDLFRDCRVVADTAELSRPYLSARMKVLTVAF